MLIHFIDKVVKERQPDIVRTQMKLLDEFEKRMPKLATNGAGVPIAHTPEELVSLRRALVTLQGDVRELKASHAAIEDRQKTLLATIETAKGDVGKLIDGETHP